MKQQGESKLPSGPPLQKGVGLDPSIPNALQTHAKPPNEGPREEVKDESSIYRVDRADSISKSPTTDEEIDRSEDRSEYSPGKGPYNNSLTKYPYRDPVSDIKATLRIAKRTLALKDDLNPKTVERAKKCSVALKRADGKNMRWIFSVDAGNGVKMVKLWLVRKKGVVDPTKMDAKFTCNCKAWRWLGPEYHAKSEEYLNGTPIGTASEPNIKDPERINKVCKHVSATIDYVKNWRLP